MRLVRAPSAMAGDVVGARCRPGERAVFKLQQPRIARAGRRRGGVGEDHRVGLQPLGAVHGHHPHLVARHLHVALDLAFRRAQPGEEALQRRRLARLVVEREIEEFVERVVGFRARAGRGISCGRASAPEHMREEAERRQSARAPGELVERRRRRRRTIHRRSCARKDVAQRALALPGQLEQLLLGQPEQRALEHAGQRQIVVRQQQAIGQRHQVHHRDVLGQHQPVGAGDRHARRLERADDRLEQRPALAHQHQHLAGLQPASRPRLTCAAIFCASRTRGLISLSCRRARPSLRSRASLGRLDQRPQLDQAGRGVGQRLVLGHADFVGGDAHIDVARA